MIRYILYTFVVWLTISSSLYAQDAIFSQYFATPIQLNPALTGSTFSPRFTLNYRNQWPSLSNAYVTYAASYDQLFPDINSGFGVLVSSDVAGDGIFKTSQFVGAYSYNLEIGKGMYMKGGLEAGFTQTNVNWDKLVFLDQLNPLTGSVDGAGNPNPTQELQPPLTNRLYVDAGAGLLIYNKTFHAGVSAKHINSPDESILRDEPSIVPMRLTVHAGADINLRTNHKDYIEGTHISPNFMYVRQGEFEQLNVGAYARMSSIFGGAWFRHAFGNSDAVILLVGFQQSIFKVGYSYDVTVSGLGGRSGGAHEVSVVINFDDQPKFRRKYKGKQYMNCLQMFKF